MIEILYFGETAIAIPLWAFILPCVITFIIIVLAVIGAIAKA
jgi:hypothetical protein